MLMSLRRIRKLAGLKESFTPDPELNDQIEAKIDVQPPETRNIWMDVLEFIYDKRTVSRKEISDHLQSLHDINENPSMFANVINSVEKVFGDLVKKDGNNYKWDMSTGEDIDDSDVDPRIKAAIGGQIDATYTALEIMRDLTARRAGFTIDELTHQLSNRLHLPANIVTDFVEHIMTQFQSMLVKTGNRYVIKSDRRPTRDDNMSLFRELEKNAKNQKFD